MELSSPLLKDQINNNTNTRLHSRQRARIATCRLPSSSFFANPTRKYFYGQASRMPQILKMHGKVLQASKLSHEEENDRSKVFKPQGES